MHETEVHELYMPPIFFYTIGGFSSRQAFNDFCKRYQIEQMPRGYPVFRIMNQLVLVSKNRTVAGSLQEEYTKAKINKETTLTAIKRKEYIARDLAIDRMRTTMMAVANKIRYGIKMAAPRVCGLMSAYDIESILTEVWNSCIDQLGAEAKSLESWETYGINFQSTGSEMVEDPEEGDGFGSPEENTSFD